MAQPTITMKLVDNGSTWTNDLVFFCAHNAANALSGPTIGTGGITVEDADHVVAYRLTSGGNLIADAAEKNPTTPPSPEPEPEPKAEPTVIVEPEEDDDDA